MKHLPIRSYLVGTLLAAAASSSAWALDLNAASTVDLVNSGVSRNVAQKIVAHHKIHGDFQSTEDLLKVPGVTVNTVQRLSNKLTINGVHLGANASIEASSSETATDNPAASGNEIHANTGVSTGINSGISAGASSGAGLGAGIGIGANAGISLGGGAKQQ